MKKFLIWILIFSLLFSISVTATSNTYDLDELELQVTIPTGYSVITRDTPASDSIFSKLNTTKSVLISQFETSNIYLNAITNTLKEEVVVTMTENSLSNFSLLSDTVLNTLATSLVSQYTDYGINVSKHEIYQHSQAKFIKIYFSDTANTVHGLQYYTIYNGKAMNFTMRSYEGSLSSKQETTIKTIVDSIKYDKSPPIAEQGENTNSFIHTDTDSGVTFTVPANWKQEAFTKEREYIDVKFISTKEDGCSIIYGSTDMWSKMPASDKIGYNRSDINNSAFTKSDIATMCNLTEDEISTVAYNGIQYFKGEPSATSNEYGINISVTMTQLFYIDNGWMYMFQFGGTSTHKLYSDFESLLNSVQYPTDSNISGVSSTNNTYSGTDTSNNNSGIVAVVILFLIIVIIVVAVILSRKTNTDTTSATTDAPIDNIPIPEPTNNTELTLSCKNCGQLLPSDSKFCHVCGAKIEMED